MAFPRRAVWLLAPLAAAGAAFWSQRSSWAPPLETTVRLGGRVSALGPFEPGANDSRERRLGTLVEQWTTAR
jgi:hypothetical protein